MADAAVLKTADFGRVGSNPTAPTIHVRVEMNPYTFTAISERIERSTLLRLS